MTRSFTSLLTKTNLLVFCLLFSYVVSINLDTHRVLTEDQPRQVGSPSSYDWRSFTTITPVKNQADCNAYYAFSTAAFFEQDLILFEGASTNIDLSQQFLTSCLPSGGCVGGNPKDAMELVLKKGGIPVESTYPFAPWGVHADDICYPTKEISVGTRPMYGFWNLEDQQFLKSLIMKQPLNIYICSQDLKSYAPKSNSDRTLSCNVNNQYGDHSVLLIGYTQTEWIIKNSWSTDWGLGGFGYISRNADNDCGIGSQVFMRGKQSKDCSIENCEVCADNNYCSKCKPGYYVSNKNSTQTCVECNYANCAQCANNVGYCKTCIFGYALYFPEQVCKLSVIENCKSIVNGGCKFCHDGYKVNANFTCETDCKIANCDVCKDDKSCSTCKPGFKLTFANGTLSCVENKCKTENCDTCDAQGKCLTCFGSYKVVEDSCVMNCNKQNCQQCSQTKDLCAKCISGYALDYYSHECVQTNVANCNQTYLTKYCSICQDGHIRSDSWETCAKICAIDNCKTCQAGLANKCTACNDGYTLKTPKDETIAICEKNPCNLANCSLCSTAGDTCVQCVDKYHVWDWTKKACVAYSCPLSNCAKCQTDSKKCEQCNADTVAYVPTGGCIKSPIERCVAVGVSDNGTECWNCDNGFQVNYETWKSCERICKDSSCLDCADSATICKKCLDGYGLKSVSDSENKCVKIPTYLPNCLRGNSDQTICYECKQFYFFNNETSSCDLNENCPKDCIKCTGQNQTMKCECKSGFVWDFLNNVCVLNPSDSQCLVISNYTGTPQCFECKDGFTLTNDGKGCESDCSVNNCKDCVRSDVQIYPDYCQTCVDGFIPNSNLTKCLQCQVDYCKTCKSPNQLSFCTECKIGYELKDDGSCVQIPCQTNAVFNGLECACLNTFYKDSSTEECKNCITSCKRCNSGEKCLECVEGFYLNGGKCATCLENCQTCSDSSSCDACQQGFTYQILNGKNLCVEIGLGRDGYFILSNGKKARCEPGCASCAKSQLSCQQCLKGYILQNQKCIKCSDNCETCYPNILNACKTCEIGFSLVEGQCVRCKSSMCTECPVQTDICTACLPGYYVKDQTCKNCGVGCNECSADGKCTSCHTGFAYFSDGYCEQCLDGCAECNSEAMHECMGGCLSGTYRSDDKCVNCPSECKTCNKINECTTCIPGYDLVKGVCRKWCSDTNCFDCSSDSDMCVECYAGYAQTNGKCTQDFLCNNEPKSNNTTDTNSTDNSTSETNSTTNETNTNQTKNQTLDTSGESANCEICPKKYYLSQDYTCLSCTTTESNCVSCSRTAPTDCTQCATNYYLNAEQKCSKCADNCQTCRSEGYCYICNAGSYMVQEQKQYSGNCASCDDNCLTCVDKPKNCLSCKPGYVLSVANFCMSQDSIRYVIKLDMPFNKFSKQLKPIRADINNIIESQQNSYLTQFKKAWEGSTLMQGTVACSASGQGDCKAYDRLVSNIKGGSYIAGYQVISASIEYDGKAYNSDRKDTESQGGVQGWIIAVAVVGGIVALILIIVIITCISKKIKKNKEENSEDEEQKNTDSLKQTEQNLNKKQNPQLN